MSGVAILGFGTALTAALSVKTDSRLQIEVASQDGASVAFSGTEDTANIDTTNEIRPPATSNRLRFCFIF